MHPKIHRTTRAFWRFETSSRDTFFPQNHDWRESKLGTSPFNKAGIILWKLKLQIFTSIANIQRSRKNIGRWISSTVMHASQHTSFAFYVKCAKHQLQENLTNQQWSKVQTLMGNRTLGLPPKNPKKALQNKTVAQHPIPLHMLSEFMEWRWIGVVMMVSIASYPPPSKSLRKLPINVVIASFLQKKYATKQRIVLLAVPYNPHTHPPSPEKKEEQLSPPTPTIVTRIEEPLPFNNLSCKSGVPSFALTTSLARCRSLHAIFLTPGISARF